MVSNCPDVVLLDLGLPDMTGHDIAKEIFKRSAQRIPIIGCSGYSDGEEREKALKSDWSTIYKSPFKRKSSKRPSSNFFSEEANIYEKKADRSEAVRRMSQPERSAIAL